MSIMLQKAVTPKMTTAYLERGLDRVSGYLVPASDAASVTTTEGLFELHGLSFRGSPFAPDHPIDILHVPPSPSITTIPATGGTDQRSRQATGGTFIEHEPFTGTGFATTGDVMVPLMWLEQTRIPTGARLWRFSPGSDEPELIGTYHGPAFGWQNHLADDEFHAVPPSKLVGFVAKFDGEAYSADVTLDEDDKPQVVTLVSHTEPQIGGFRQTDAGIWARKVLAENAEVFTLRATSTWHDLPVRVVDQGPGPDGQASVHIVSLAHDAIAAEKAGFSRLDAGVYVKTVPQDDVGKIVYTQQVPRAWATEEQMEKAAEAARGRAFTGAGTGATPQVQVKPTGDADGPMSQHAGRMQRIAQGLASVLPADWKQAQVLLRVAGRKGEFTVLYTGEDDQRKPLKGVPADVGEALTEIKAASADPKTGTWLTGLVTLERSGKMTLSTDRTSPPRWKKEPEAAEYAEELRRYPRDEEHIPDWLREKIAEAEDDSSPES